MILKSMISRKLFDSTSSTAILVIEIDMPDMTADDVIMSKSGILTNFFSFSEFGETYLTSSIVISLSVSMSVLGARSTSS